jgi:hypothetical protein
MPLELEEYPVSEIEATQWDGLLDRVDNPSPFLRHAWLRLIAAAWPSWRVRLILLKDSGSLAGGFACVDRDDNFCRQSHGLPWGTPSGLVLVNPADRSAADRLVEQWSRRLNGCHRPYRLAMTFSEARPAGLASFEKHGFQPMLQRSLLVPVAGRKVDEWEASLSDSVRNQNRQAVRRGAIFSRADSGVETPDILHLAELTARRHNRPVAQLGERFYRLLLDPSGPLAGSGNLVRVYIVRVGETAAAFSVCLTWKRRLWLWDYGADQNLFQARPNNHMYHRVIASAFSEGLDAVELGVVPDGASSLADFKRGFGGMPYERLTVVKSSSLFRFGEFLRRLAHRPSRSG